MGDAKLVNDRVDHALRDGTLGFLEIFLLHEKWQDNGRPNMKCLESYIHCEKTKFFFALLTHSGSHFRESGTHFVRYIAGTVPVRY